MKTLLEQIQNRTKKNLVKQTSKKNICDHLHELLGDGKNEMDRLEVINHISEYRLKKEFPELTEKSVLDDKQLKRLDSIMITVKNGLDTAVCNGSTGSSYNANSKYSEYKLLKDNGMLKIVKRATK